MARIGGGDTAALWIGGGGTAEFRRILDIDPTHSSCVFVLEDVTVKRLAAAIPHQT